MTQLLIKDVTRTCHITHNLLKVDPEMRSLVDILQDISHLPTAESESSDITVILLFRLKKKCYVILLYCCYVCSGKSLNMPGGECIGIIIMSFVLLDLFGSIWW